MSDSPSGPDLAKGSPLSSIADGSMLLGHVDGEAVLLARRGNELFAIGAVCSHYGGPLADGASHDYDALLLTTGAESVRLDVPGSGRPNVHYLRTVADCNALIAKALPSTRAVVIGSSFIGLEVTASLRARNVAVQSSRTMLSPCRRFWDRRWGRSSKRSTSSTA